MHDFSQRVVAATVVLTLAVGGSAAMADEPVEDFSDLDGAGVDELEAEPLEDQEDLAVEDDDGDAEPDEVRDDDWETPLRNRITPVMSQEGTVGFHGITSAVSPGPLQFQVGLFGQATGGTDFVRHNDEHGAWTGGVLVNASINDYFGAHFRTGASNSVNTFGRPQAMLSQGDMNLGVTGRYEVDNGIHYGADLNLFVPSQFGGVGIGLPSASVRPRALASFDFDAIAGQMPDVYIPIIAHLNVGYRFDNSESLVEDIFVDRIERTAYGISAYDMVEFGVGAEFPMPYVTPFVGWNMGIPVNADDEVCADDRPLDCVADIGAAAYPQRLSLGAKAEPLDNLGLHAGMDIGLTGEHVEGLPVTYPYEFHFGVSWNIDPAGAAAARARIEASELEAESEPAPQLGYLEAVVLDEETGEPVEGARISYVDRELNPQLSADETGAFRSYDFELGEEVTLAIDHPDYEADQIDWIVEPVAEDAESVEEADEDAEETEADQAEVDEAGPLEVVLTPILRSATIAGQVVDEVGEPLGVAEVTLTTGDGEFIELSLDDQGRFEHELDAQTATVAAMYDNLLPAGAFIEIDDQEQFEFEFALREVDQWLAEADDEGINLNEGIQFEPEEATLRDESADVLDHIAAVILQHGDAGVLHIQAHTADDGEDDEMIELSQQRAEAVVEALAERGVNPARLDPEGFGANRPRVPNTSNRNREMNRRVEFDFVSEE